MIFLFFLWYHLGCDPYDIFTGMMSRARDPEYVLIFESNDSSMRIFRHLRMSGITKCLMCSWLLAYSRPFNISISLHLAFTYTFIHHKYSLQPKMIFILSVLLLIGNPVVFSFVPSSFHRQVHRTKQHLLRPRLWRAVQSSGAASVSHNKRMLLPRHRRRRSWLARNLL